MITAIARFLNLSELSKHAYAFAFYISVWYKNGTGIEINHKRRQHMIKLQSE